MSRTGTAAAAVVALVMTPLVAGSVDAAPAGPTAWQAPVVVSSPGGAAHGVDVAVTPDGTTVAVYERAERIQVRRSTRSGAWSRPRTLGVGVDPQVGVDGRGATTVLWRHATWRGGGLASWILAARRPPGGTWSAPVRLSKRIASSEDVVIGAFAPELAVSDGGAVVATWIWGSEDVGPGWQNQAVYRPPGGPWRETRALNSRGEGGWDPQAAVDRAGNATVMYGVADRLRVRRFVRGRGWGPETTLARDVWSTDLAAGPGGTVAAWVRRDRKGFARVRAAWRPVGEPWRTPVTVSPADTHAVGAALAMDRSGEATVAWARRNGMVQSAVGHPPGRWSAPLVVAPPGKPVGTSDGWGGGASLNLFDLSSTPGGDAVLAWTRSDDPFAAQGRGEVATRAAGTWSAPQRLTAPGTAARQLATAGGPGGEVAATWVRHRRGVPDRAVVRLGRIS